MKSSSETAKLSPKASSRSPLGERVPRLRFPGFTGEWGFRRMGDLGDFTKGAPLSKADISDEGTPFILYGELYTTYGEIIRSVIRRTNAKTGNQYKSRSGDVIIPTSGETPEEIATASCVIPEGVILGGDLNVFRGRKVDGRFLAYLIRHKASHRIARIAQGVSIVHVSSSELRRVGISIPSPHEQEKIVAFLDLLDARIAAQRRLVELLKKHKRGVIEEIFGQDNTDWNRCRLGDIATINPSTGTLPSEFYYIDLESVSDGVWGRRTLVRREDAPSRAQRNVALEDILFQTVRPYQQNNYFVGCELDKPVVASTGYAQIRTREEPIFVYWMLHSPSFLREVMLRCTGSGYPAVNATDLAEIVVAVPNRADQKRCATLITQIAKRCNAEEAILSLLESSKRGFLQQLFV